MEAVVSSETSVNICQTMRHDIQRMADLVVNIAAFRIYDQICSVTYQVSNAYGPGLVTVDGVWNDNRIYWTL
jgi:hypothetical protein